MRANMWTGSEERPLALLVAAVIGIEAQPFHRAGPTAGGWIAAHVKRQTAPHRAAIKATVWSSSMAWRERNATVADEDRTPRKARVTHSPAVSVGAQATGTQAIGTLTLAALAVGALAIGALAIGRLAIGRARIRRLEIDELVVRRLRVTEQLQTPPDGGPGS